MQTLQPNAEAARLAKLKVPQLREELGNLGLVKGGNKTVLIQRLLAQPGAEGDVACRMIREWRAMEIRNWRAMDPDPIQVLASHDLEALDGRAERLRVLRAASLSMLREYRECNALGESRMQCTGGATPNIQRADKAAGKLCDLIEQYHELHGTEEQLLNYKENRAWHFDIAPLALLMLGHAIEEQAVGGPDYQPGRGLSRSLSGRVIGLYKTKDKQAVRAVFKGPKGGIYTKTPSGSRSRPKNEDWEPMEEAEVKQRIAQHEAWKSASPSK